SITENEPVLVSQLAVEVTDDPSLTPKLEGLRPELPLQVGQVFTEKAYQDSDARIKAFFLDLHYGRVKVERKADAILDQHQAAVRYTVEAGPVTVFGDTTIEGTKQVAPEIVARELTYKPGELFSSTAISDSRKKILNLDLFSTVRFIEESN